jgi:MFS family permease
MAGSARSSTGRSRDVGALSLLAAAQFAVAADFTVVFIALPVLGRDLALDQQGLQWVVTAYGLPFGGCLLLAGRLADLLGRRSMFMVGHLLFGGSSAVAAAAGSPIVLLIARAVQGIGAALLVPATLALLHAMFAPGVPRNRALGVWGAAGASGGALGVVLGGALTSAFGWQVIFLVNVPLSVLSVSGARRWLLPDAPRRSVSGADVLGAALVTLGGMLQVLSVSLWSRGGLTVAVLLTSAGAGACLACFAGYEWRSADPLLPRRLLGIPTVVVAAAVIAIFYASLNNQLYLLTLGAQDVLGRSAAQTGLLIVPYSVAIAVGTGVGARLTGRWGARTAAVAGMGAGVLGVLVLATAVVEPERTVVGLIVSGLGQGTAWTGIWAALSSAVDEGDQGVASGAVSAMGQFGQAAGLVLLAAVVTAGEGTTVSRVTGAGVRVGLFTLAAAALVGMLAAALLPRGVGINRQPVEMERR